MGRKKDVKPPQQVDLLLAGEMDKVMDLAPAILIKRMCGDCLGRELGEGAVQNWCDKCGDNKLVEETPLTYDDEKPLLTRIGEESEHLHPDDKFSPASKARLVELGLGPKDGKGNPLWTTSGAPESTPEQAEEVEEAPSVDDYPWQSGQCAYCLANPVAVTETEDGSLGCAECLGLAGEPGPEDPNPEAETSAPEPQEQAEPVGEEAQPAVTWEFIAAQDREYLITWLESLPMTMEDVKEKMGGDSTYDIKATIAQVYGIEPPHEKKEKTKSAPPAPPAPVQEKKEEQEVARKKTAKKTAKPAPKAKAKAKAPAPAPKKAALPAASGKAKAPAKEKAATPKPKAAAVSKAPRELSNKAKVYQQYLKGVKDPAKLFKHVKEAVKENTIKGWVGQWEKGKNLPAIANG